MQTLITSNYLPKIQPESFYESDFFISYFLPKWKQKKLWIQARKGLQVICLPTEDDKQWLVSCLSRSPIEAVCLHSDLGETSLELWADACRMARKPVFLRLSSSLASRLSAKGKIVPSRKSMKRRLKQAVDWGLAMAILLVFSPLMLGLMLFIRSQGNQLPLGREWCVGEQGRIFQWLTFNIQLPLGLKRLPNLVSVLRGETNLRQTNHYPLRQILQ